MRNVKAAKMKSERMMVEIIGWEIREVGTMAAQILASRAIIINGTGP